MINDDNEFFDGLVWFTGFVVKALVAVSVLVVLIFMLVISALNLYDQITH